MAKICHLCKDTKSWRFHALNEISYTTYIHINEHFLLKQPVSKAIAILCNACHGNVGRFAEFVNKLKKRNEMVEEREDTLSNISNTPAVEKYSASICLNDMNDELFDKTKASVQSNRFSDDTDAITTGLKRPYLSDHTYGSISKCQDHDYISLHGQEEDTHEREDNHGTIATIDKIKEYLPPISSSTFYDYQSVLKKKTVYDLIEDDLVAEIIAEMDERCSELLLCLLNVAVKNESAIGMRHLTSIAVAYASLMFARNNHNSSFQRIITMMAVQGNSNDEFIRRLNRMSLTLSCSGKIKLLDKAAESNRSKLIQFVKENPRIKVTGDNLDMYVRTNHQRQDNGNKDIHWFASNVITARINYSNISNEKPNIEVEDIAAETFLANEAENQKLRDVKKVIIGRLISDSEKYAWIKETLPVHIPHSYTEYMCRKQEVFGLPVLFKNESKNEDCLDIMQNLEKELIDIFNEAYGSLEVLNSYGVILGGDQLTRERLQNVKNIRHMALTPEGRFQHLHPIVCEFWHVKQDLLSKAYKALYQPKCLDKGTLYQVKVILRRTDVTGNVKSNYKAHEDLFLLMVKALLHVATDDLKEDEQDRDVILSKIYYKIHGEGYGSDDGVLNYFVNLIRWGLQILNMNDTAKEGDVDRVIMNCKENIPFFYGHSKLSKYYTEMVNLILLTDHLLSPAMRLRVLEGAFVNTKGGHGKNKEADLVQEHSIRNKKDLIRSLGANKTEKAVSRSCSAADTCYRTSARLDLVLGITKLSAQHTKKSSSKDLEILIKLLRDVQPFHYKKR